MCPSLHEMCARWATIDTKFTRILLASPGWWMTNKKKNVRKLNLHISDDFQTHLSNESFERGEKFVTTTLENWTLYLKRKKLYIRWKLSVICANICMALFFFLLCQSAFHKTLYLTDEILFFFCSFSSFAFFHCKRGWSKMCVSSNKLIWNIKKWFATNVDTSHNNQGKMNEMEEENKTKRRETGM